METLDIIQGLDVFQIFAKMSSELHGAVPRLECKSNRIFSQCTSWDVKLRIRKTMEKQYVVDHSIQNSV